VDFIFGEINDVEMILPQTLEVAEISFANFMALHKCRTFKLPRPDFGDVMCQWCPRPLQFL
jgi:hypothetical protein